MRRTRRAYTLLEMLLVLAILVILGALAYPSIDGMYSGVKLRAGADALRAALMQGRSHAIDETRSYRVCVIPGAGSFRVAPDSPEYWGGSGGTPTPDDPNNPPYVQEDKLPRGIVFVMGDVGAGSAGGPSGSGGDSGGWVPVVTFLATGEATADTQVVLQVPGTRPLVVRVRSMTGTVTVTRGGQP